MLREEEEDIVNREKRLFMSKRFFFLSSFSVCIDAGQPDKSQE